MVFTSIVLPSPLQQKREVFSNSALNRIRIQSIYCFNYCLYMKFGTAALLRDICSSPDEQLHGGQGPGLLSSAHSTEIPEIPGIRSEMDPAAPWDAVDVSILHQLKFNREGWDCTDKNQAQLGWMAQRSFFNSSWRILQYVFCSFAEAAKICFLTPWRFHPHLREQNLPTLNEADPCFRVFPLLKPSQIIQQRFCKAPQSQTRAKMLCSTSSCCGFCCGNQFGLEPKCTLSDPWVTAGTSQPPRGTASCDTPVTKQTHPGATGLPPAASAHCISSWDLEEKMPKKGKAA